MDTEQRKRNTGNSLTLLFVLVACFLFTPFSLEQHDAHGVTLYEIQNHQAQAQEVPQPDVVSKKAQEEVETNIDPDDTWLGTLAYKVATSIGRWLGNALLNIGSMFTYFGGMLLEYTIEEFVLGFGLQFAENNSAETAGLGESVKNVWELIRDMSNLLFIFGFVYIGVRLIIDSDSSSARRQLASLIIAALLINFSFLITKVVIEFSNILSHTIYSEMFIPSTTAEMGDENVSGLAGEITHILGVQSWFKPPDTAEQTEHLTGGGAIGFYIMGAAFLIITGFVFISGALMLITRFVALIFIMMFSPLLFAASALPQTAHYAKDLWKKLLSYSFFAPAYLFMILIGIYIIKATVGNTLGENSFTNVFSNPRGGLTGGYTIVLNFVLAIAIIYLASTVAKKMGLVGGELAIKIADRGKNMVKSAAMKPVRGTASLGKWGGEKAKLAASRQLRSFEFGTEGTALGALGRSKAGKFLLKVDPILTQVQKGGFYYKKATQQRAAELAGLRNSQLDRKTDTFLANPDSRLNKLFGGKLIGLRNREIMATALAYNNKGDLDEILPEKLQLMMKTFAKTGQGFTKIARKRMDAGEPHRFSRNKDKKELLFKKRHLETTVLADGTETHHWVNDDEVDGQPVYLKIDVDTAKEFMNDDGLYDYKLMAEHANAETIDSVDYLMGVSEIQDLTDRTKRASETALWHNRNATDTGTPKSPGGYDRRPGYRPLQVDELGDSLVARATGEQVAKMMQQRNAYTTQYLRALHELAGVSNESQHYVNFFKTLEKKALKIGDNNMASRVRSQADYFATPAGQRAIGLDMYAKKGGSGGGKSGSKITTDTNIARAKSGQEPREAGGASQTSDPPDLDEDDTEDFIEGEEGEA